jgi:hypothetical protein
VVDFLTFLIIFFPILNIFNISESAVAVAAEPASVESIIVPAVDAYDLADPANILDKLPNNLFDMLVDFFIPPSFYTFF